ncbi:MAG: NUDIX hydrolase [Phormidesmis sp.]
MRIISRLRRIWHPVRTLLQLILRRPLVAASVIAILPDDRLVLIRRRDSGLWGLPGGLVDWGEDVQTAAKRELLEETGLTLISPGRLVGVYSAKERDERFHSICVALAAKAEGSMDGFDPDEVLEVSAFYRHELPTEQMAHDHRQQLQDYFEGKTVLA